MKLETLSNALIGTPMEGRDIEACWSNYSVEPLFLIDLEDSGEEWAILSSLRARTGRYPVLSSGEYVEMQFHDEAPSQPDETGSWAAKTHAKSLLMNDAADNENYVFSPTRTEDLFGWLDRSLDDPVHPFRAILKRFGEAPSIDEVRALRSAGTLKTDADLERWLWAWELERFGDAALAAPDGWYLENYDFKLGDPCVAVLLPTLHPSKALIDMGWSALDGGDDVAKAATLRMWHERWGAELVASFSASVHMQAKKRPQSVDEAFQLAIEHYNFASDIMVLPGIPLRDHARTLLASDRWYFLKTM